MKLSSLTFRDLQYLVALDLHGHFGKASKACHVSQPALSTQIKKIEGYFGKKLFERQNKIVFATPDGVKIIENVKKILDEAKGLEELFQAKKNILSSTLKIGIISTLAAYYPPFFIPKLKHLYPHLTLTILDGYTEDLLHELKSGKIDILIASEVFTDERLIVFPLFEEPIYVLVNHDHLLAKKEEILTSDLNAENMFFLKDRHCLKDEAVDLCPKNKRGNIQETAINNIETLKQMVAFNNSYAIIPALAGEIQKTFKNMVSIKRFKHQNKVTRNISMFIRKESARIKDYEAFLAVIKETLPEFVL